MKAIIHNLNASKMTVTVILMSESGGAQKLYYDVDVSEIIEEYESHKQISETYQHPYASKVDGRDIFIQEIEEALTKLKTPIAIA
jgi:hypothetical protein